MLIKRYFIVLQQNCLEKKKKVCKEEKIKEIVQVGHKETSRGHKVVRFPVTCRLLHT